MSKKPKRTPRVLTPWQAAVKHEVDKADFEGLLRLGCPADEYDTEAIEIANRCGSAQSLADVEAVLRSTFVHWFSDSDTWISNSGEPPKRYIRTYPADHFDAVAATLWTLIQESRAAFDSGKTNIDNLSE